MNSQTARAVSLLLALANSACSSDGPGPLEGGGASEQSGAASAGGGAAGLGGQSAVAGAVSAAGGGSAGAPSGGASAGGAGDGSTALTPEGLRMASYAECSKGCNLVHSACPSFSVADCGGGCTSQADNFFASGKCGVELYEVMACINRTLKASDITCPATPGGNAQFNGCSAEQLRFAQCS